MASRHSKSPCALHNANVLTVVCGFLSTVHLSSAAGTARTWHQVAQKPALWAHINVVFRPYLTLEQLGRLLERSKRQLRSIVLAACASVSAIQLLPRLSAVGHGSAGSIVRLAVTQFSGDNRTRQDEDHGIVVSELLSWPPGVSLVWNGAEMRACAVEKLAVGQPCGRRALCHAYSQPGAGVVERWGCEKCLDYCDICDQWKPDLCLDTCDQCAFKFCRYGCGANDDTPSVLCQDCSPSLAVQLQRTRCEICAKRVQRIHGCDECSLTFCGSCAPALLLVCPSCCLRACRFQCFAATGRCVVSAQLHCPRQTARRTMHEDNKGCDHVLGRTQRE